MAPPNKNLRKHRQAGRHSDSFRLRPYGSRWFSFCQMRSAMCLLRPHDKAFAKARSKSTPAEIKPRPDRWSASYMLVNLTSGMATWNAASLI